MRPPDIGVTVALLVAAFVVVSCGAARHVFGSSARRPNAPVASHGTAVGNARDRPRALRAAAGRTRTLLMLGLITPLAVIAFGPMFALVGAGGIVLGRRIAPVLAARRRQVRIGRAVPDAVELFVLSVHAGLTPVQAVHELTRTAPEIVRDGFDAVVHRLERGEPFGTALRALPDRLGSGMVGLADVIASADRYGLPLAPVLESLAVEARAARRRSDEADARRLPVKLAFPLVTCTLPSFVLLAITPAIVAALSSLDLTL